MNMKQNLLEIWGGPLEGDGKVEVSAKLKIVQVPYGFNKINRVHEHL